MKHPRQAQVAWEICKLISELEEFHWHLFWDEFEAIYQREETQKYWGSIIHTDKHMLH